MKRSFFFDTADAKYIEGVWDTIHPYFDPQEVAGITTNPSAFSKINVSSLKDMETNLLDLGRLLSNITNNWGGTIWVQLPNSMMLPNEIIEWAKHLRKIEANIPGNIEIGMKIPPYEYVLDLTQDITYYIPINVTGIADCSTALRALSYKYVKHASIIHGRMEEKGIDADAHLLFLRGANTKVGQSIITGSMRTLSGLYRCIRLGTTPTVGMGVWDQIIEDKERIKDFASAWNDMEDKDSTIHYSPEIDERNTKLSIDFFSQMDDLGESLYQEFDEKLSKGRA